MKTLDKVWRGLIILAFIAIVWGCVTSTPHPPNPKPNPTARGCSCFFQSLGSGTDVVYSAWWTNRTTGSFMSGLSFNIPESGGILNVEANPDIACASSPIDLAMIVWSCPPNSNVYAFLTMKTNSEGIVLSGPIFSCTNCSFSTGSAMNWACSNAQAVPFGKNYEERATMVK